MGLGDVGRQAGVDRRVDAQGVGLLEHVLEQRRNEADTFYHELCGKDCDAEASAIQRQAYAGLIWSKQFYWYDVRTGVAGRWGGPVAVFLPPGLPLAGPLPAEASGGGSGRLTAVFINGRELHPSDVMALRQYGPVIPGRYNWDAQGNVSTETGFWLFNFYAVLQARQQQQGGGTYHRSDPSRGESTTVTSGCAAVSGRLRSSDSSSGYSYYVGCN